MSVFIGVMTLMSTAVGTAVFTLSYLIFQSGIIISTFLILFGGVLSYYTMIWLIDASFKTKKNNYATIITKLLGKKTGLFLHFVFILTTFGVTTIYIILLPLFFP